MLGMSSKPLGTLAVHHIVVVVYIHFIGPLEGLFTKQ